MTFRGPTALGDSQEWLCHRQALCRPGDFIRLISADHEGRPYRSSGESNQTRFDREPQLACPLIQPKGI